jgi:hypothetical protein
MLSEWFKIFMHYWDAYALVCRKDLQTCMTFLDTKPFNYPAVLVPAADIEIEIFLFCSMCRRHCALSAFPSLPSSIFLSLRPYGCNYYLAVHVQHPLEHSRLIVSSDPLTAFDCSKEADVEAVCRQRLTRATSLTCSPS